MTPSRIACTAALAAPSASFSPIRRATTAMAPTLKPIATAYRQDEHRLGQSHRCHGIGAQPRHEEHVHHGENRFEAELEHHRNRQQHNRVADGSCGVVPVFACQRLARQCPQRPSAFGESVRRPRCRLLREPPSFA